MRELADEQRIRRFMRALGSAAEQDGDCYLVGGATAVLLGWRQTTLDVDIRLEPEQEAVLRALPSIKEELAVNVELASPADFIPLPAGWRERSAFAGREGRLTFRHFDLYSQALAKLERSHAQGRAGSGLAIQQLCRSCAVCFPRCRDPRRRGSVAAWPVRCVSSSPAASTT